MENRAAGLAAPNTVSSLVRTREYLTAREIERLMAAARKGSRWGHRPLVRRAARLADLRPDEELRRRVVLAEERLADLKAALEDMRARRDAWQAMAEAHTTGARVLDVAMAVAARNGVMSKRSGAAEPPLTP